MDEHIMSDGRPAWAWESERAMMDADAKHNRDELQRVNSLMFAMNVLKIARTDNPISDHMEIIFSARDLIAARNPGDPVEMASVCSCQSEGGHSK